MIKAQINFTRRKMEQLEELRRVTGATRTELVRRAVDYYIRGIRGMASRRPCFPYRQVTREKLADQSGSIRLYFPRT